MRNMEEKLKEQVHKGINKWRANAEQMYLESLEELKNIDSIESIIQQRIEGFDSDAVRFVAAREIGRKIGVC